MTQAVVNFFNFTPTHDLRNMFHLRANQFLDFVPLESQIKFLIKEAKNGKAFQGFVTMNTAWGEFSVRVMESSPEDVLERIGLKLKAVVNSKRKSLSAIQPTSPDTHVDDTAFNEIQDFENSLATGG